MATLIQVHSTLIALDDPAHHYIALETVSTMLGKTLASVQHQVKMLTDMNFAEITSDGKFARLTETGRLARIDGFTNSSD